MDPLWMLERLRAVRRGNLRLNAFTHLLDERSVGSADNELWVAVKDNLMVKGMPMEAGSRALAGYTPAEDAACVAALRREGALILGKTGMDEFGMGSLGMHGSKGPVHNPLFPGRSAGGSSAGSAAAVAAGMCDLALGSDTGGSVRLPAAYCGVIGFKPSYGRISRHGLVTYASSLDTIGILSKSIRLIGRAFDVMRREGGGDMTWREGGTCQSSRTPPFTIGLVSELFPAECSPEAVTASERALQMLIDRGHRIRKVSLPVLQKALPAYYITCMVEASSCLARYSGHNFTGLPAVIPAGLSYAQKLELFQEMSFGPEVKERLAMGAALSSGPVKEDTYRAAQRIRSEIKMEFARLFQDVDFILCPTAPSGPPPLTSTTTPSTSSEWASDILTVPASLAGLPAISLPLRAKGDHPMGMVGVQLIGPQDADEELLALSASLLLE